MADHVILSDPGRSWSIGGATLTPYVYVVDSLNHRVQAFNYDGIFQFSFGSFGTGNGQFNEPYGIASDGTLLYVTDQLNHRVQIFTLWGVYVAQFGTFGTGVDQLDTPMGIHVDDNYVWVSDHGNNVFRVFTKQAPYSEIYQNGVYDGVAFNGPTDAWGDYYFFYIYDAGNLRMLQFPKSFDFSHSGQIDLPAITVSGTCVCRSSRGNIVLPVLTVEGESYGGTVCRGSIVFPTIEIAGTSRLSALSMIGAIVFPAFEADGHCYSGGLSSGNIVLPVLTTAGRTLPDTHFDGDIVLPVFSVAGFCRRSSGGSTYQGIVTNVKTRAISEYGAAFAFNSFCVIDNVLYGANDSGLWPIGGQDDNGSDIQVSVKTGVVGLREKTITRILEAYLWWRSYGDAVLRVEEDEDENDVTDYDVQDANDKLHETRKKFAGGHKGEVVSLEFTNVGSSDFDLHEIRLRTTSVPERRR